MSLPLPEELSPCANVRRTCWALMNNDNNCPEDVVTIDANGVKKLSQEISQSIQKNDGSSAIVEWDEEGWHYTGTDYRRSSLSSEDQEWHRRERVALYVLALDSINFCFWPFSDSTTKANLLEYEHLAIALQQMARADDNDAPQLPKDDLKSTADKSNMVIQAEDSYAFAPQRLCQLTPEGFLRQIQSHLPSPSSSTQKEEEGSYELDNVEERVRLLRELGHGLLHHYHGSAVYMISQAHQRADTLVHLLTCNFPGFRDSSISQVDGRQIFFYKRAQICVGDLWASLHASFQGCDFMDMDKLTTFADYRVPQLLRNTGVLCYTHDLSNLIDSNTIIPAGSNYEVYIRAATVVAVELLVKELQENCNIDNMSAMKLDWYLWQLGEKRHRHHQLEPFHKVRTIFY